MSEENCNTLMFWQDTNARLLMKQEEEEAHFVYGASKGH